MKKYVLLFVLVLFGAHLSGCGSEDKNPTSPNPTPTAVVQSYTVLYRVTGTANLTSISAINYKISGQAAPVDVVNPALPWEISVTLNTGDGYGLSATDSTLTLPPRDPAVENITVDVYRGNTTTVFVTATSPADNLSATVSGNIN